MSHQGRRRRARPCAAGGLLVAALALSACGGSTSPARSAADSDPAPTVSSSRTLPSTTAPPSTTALASTSAAATTRPATTRPATTRAAPTTPLPAPSAHRPGAGSPASGNGPVIVIDPGHSRTITATDPSTGLDVSDYENEPEMSDVFDVALLVRDKLEAAGYRVVLTKTSVGQRRSLATRAHIANDAHADLALSIHDQAGSSGGIGFRSGNNIVYYQSVGNYRATRSGTKVYFTDSAVAAAGKRYGKIFATQRSKVENTSIRLQGNVGYDLGSRGLAAGNIWLVQLLSHVPWIYNEAGGNSAGMSGLNSSDKATYADALVAGVEHCIPPPR